MGLCTCRDSFSAWGQARTDNFLAIRLLPHGLPSSRRFCKRKTSAQNIGRRHTLHRKGQVNKKWTFVSGCSCHMMTVNPATTPPNPPYGQSLFMERPVCAHACQKISAIGGWRSACLFVSERISSNDDRESGHDMSDRCVCACGLCVSTHMRRMKTGD